MNKILLVEGQNDLHVFKNIFKKHNVNESFDVKDKEGLDKLLISIPILLKTDIDIIGIVIDADVNISSRWDSIKNIFDKAGYSMPDTPTENGLIVKKYNSPTVGIWIMPDNAENGMLEDFVKFLIPANDDLLPEVEDALLSIEDKDLNRYKPIHKSKAKINTWLAWQEDPGTPMGLAIEKTYLTTNNKLCKLFVEWINKLFNE